MAQNIEKELVVGLLAHNIGEIRHRLSMIKFVRSQFSYLFRNPFWTSLPILILIGVTLIADAVLVYLFITRFRQLVPMMPIIYSIAVFVLNLILANISFRKEPMISYIFLGGSLLVQILFVIYLLMANLASGY